MKVELGWCTLAMLGLVGCGNSGTAVVNSNPTNIKSAPAGVATLGFLDLEGSVRADVLPTTVAASVTPLAGAEVAQAQREAAASSLPACIQMTQSGNVFTYTFTSCVAANGGTLNGTVVATQTVSGSSLVYTMVFNLTSVVDASHKWVYTGSQVATISGTQGTLTSPAAGAIQAAYTDATNTANNITYTFIPMLTVNWATKGSVWVDGTYSFSQTGGQTITVTVPAATPLTFTTGCNYPTAGTLNLALTNSPAGNANATAIFGPACGTVSIDGASINVGSN